MAKERLEMCGDRLIGREAGYGGRQAPGTCVRAPSLEEGTLGDLVKFGWWDEILLT
jgi:hypothetical protein